MAYQTIEARPLAGALGAMIEGIDLSQKLNNAQASDLHQALLDHCVIFFRDQCLAPEQHLALGRRQVQRARRLEPSSFGGRAQREPAGCG